MKKLLIYLCAALWINRKIFYETISLQIAIGLQQTSLHINSALIYQEEISIAYGLLHIVETYLVEFCIANQL